MLDPSLTLQWVPGAGALASASTTVSLQLNVANWIGQSAHIYMALPPANAGLVRATWTSGGRLLPGTMVSGERRLVYVGRIDSATLRDILRVRLDADSRRLPQSQTLAFGFEIEIGA